MRIFLENDEGALWQTTEVGLAHVDATSEERAAWERFADLQVHLPASVHSRPTAKSKAWRGPFNYDLEFATGATLRLELLPGAPRVTFEVLVNSKKGKR